MSEEKTLQGQEEKKEQAQSQQEENSDIVVESVEDDMRRLGIEVDGDKEKSTEAGENQPTEKEEKSDDESKKDEQQPQKKKKSRAQKRIEYQQRRIKELEAKLAQMQQLNNDDATTERQEKEPDIDDYDTYDEYLEALAKYEEGLTDDINKEKAKQQEGTQVDDNIDKDKIVEIFEQGKDEYSDFEETVMREDLVISEDLLKSTIESEYAADILYYLGKHDDIANKLSTMPKKQMEKELVKLEVKIEDALEKDDGIESLTTKAPEPINPVKGGASEIKTIDDDVESFEEYEKLANQAYQKKMKDGFL